MSKAKGIPEHIDAPSSSYFSIGVPTLEMPYEGSSVLQVLKQDFASIDGSFPALGDAHPDQTDFFCFNLSQQEHIGGGIFKCSVLYAKITGTYEKKLRQSVNFYGVRQREVEFTESYKTIERISKQNTFTINNTLFIVPYVQSKEVIKQRELKALDLVAREPFSEEVTCIQKVAFYNKNQPNSEYPETKEKLLVKDTNASFWKKGIEEAYESQKHENSVKIGSFPQAPDAFSEPTGTNYLSETSSPSASWYASKLGEDGYIVQPTNEEPFMAGSLVKLDWIETLYR